MLGIIWIIEGQGPTVLSVDAGGVLMTYLLLPITYHISFLSNSLI